MVDEIGDAIYLVDVLIGKWADQLNRAQPHRNGRLVIRFGKNTGVRHGGEVKYDIEPIVGKMIQMQSGSWSFFKLTARDKYERLSDLRVGKTLKSDPLVLRLINGIEELLKQRETLCSALVNLKLMHNEVSKATALCLRQNGILGSLAERVELDWSLGAARAENLIIQERRARYARSKAAKAGKAATSSEEDSGFVDIDSL